MRTVSYRRWVAVMVPGFCTIGCGRPINLTDVYTRNANGQLEACSCPGDPNGGFDRRGTMLDRYRHGANLWSWWMLATCFLEGSASENETPIPGARNPSYAG